VLSQRVILFGARLFRLVLTALAPAHFQDGMPVISETEHHLAITNGATKKVDNDEKRRYGSFQSSIHAELHFLPTCPAAMGHKTCDLICL
jgi:hypothetical protein